MTGYVRKSEGNTTMSFKISDKQLLKKYNQIWKRVETLLKIEFDSEPGYSDSDIQIITKIKIYAGSMITNFLSKKMPKEKAPCKCLSITMLDSVIKAKKKYYPQTILEECKYEQAKIKMENLIDDDLEKVRLMNKIVNLMMRKIMINLTTNFLKAKKSILITIKT